MGLGKMLVAVGLAVVVVGLVMMLAAKAGVRPFRLPGDFVWQGKNTTVYLPVATSVLVSVLLTLLLGAFGRK